MSGRVRERRSVRTSSSVRIVKGAMVVVLLGRERDHEDG